MLEMPPFCHGSKVRELSKTWKTKKARHLPRGGVDPMELILSVQTPKTLV